MHALHPNAAAGASLSPPARPSSRRWSGPVALGAVLALAFAIRATPTSRIFTTEGVRLAADGDTYYHALRSEAIAAAWPAVPWTDDGMNYPYGAAIPWPPLLDQIIATASVATGPATPEHVARVAARVPPVLGTLLVAVTAALAWVLLGRGGWEAALLVAVLPAAVRQSFVGRPDHHVLEVLLASLAVLALAAGARRAGGLSWPAVLAAAIALSFWNWSGSALILLVLAACVSAIHLALPPSDPASGRAARVLALGSGGAAAVLAASVAAWGPPGALRSLGLTPITGLSVVLCALTALGAAAIVLARRHDPRAGPGRRAAHLAATGAAAAAMLAVLAAGSGAGLAHGVTALAASSPWYRAIAEFWPLVLSGRQPWTTEVRLAATAFGLAPIVLPFVAFRLRREWTRDPERRAPVVLFATWLASGCALVLLRRRFEAYAAIPLAVATAWVVRDGIDAVRPRLARWPGAPAVLTVAALAVLAAPGLRLSLTGAVVELPDGAEDEFPLLEWLATVPSVAGREAVLSTWSHGHEIRWIARKPVVSTPFGTDIDPRSIEDEAAFFTERDPSRARSLLERRRVGFLLLQNPVREVATLSAFAPGAPPLAFEELGAATGSRYAMDPAFFDLVSSRLFFFDGSARDGGGATLPDYRLLAESRSPVSVLGHTTRRFKIFGVVEGARLTVSGSRPGARIAVRADVLTNEARVFSWRAEVVADGAGRAVLRVPYATGTNGLVNAAPYVIEDGVNAKTATATEIDVVEGRSVGVDLES